MQRVSRCVWPRAISTSASAIQATMARIMFMALVLNDQNEVVGAVKGKVGNVHHTVPGRRSGADRVLIVVGLERGAVAPVYRHRPVRSHTYSIRQTDDGR